MKRMNENRKAHMNYGGDGMSKSVNTRPQMVGKTLLAAALVGLLATMLANAQSGAKDPGVRTGKFAGQSFYQLNPALVNDTQSTNINFDFPGFKNVFFEVNNSAVNPDGLGPGYSTDGCSVCHAQPAIGGSSPAVNPLFTMYNLNGATNVMPSFIKSNSPVVNARSPYMSDGVTPDGHVQQLFVVTGRPDAAGCNATQPDFAGEMAANNLIFRQTTPVFGGGLVDIIPNADILANMNANLTQKQALGISGHPSLADDGSVSRFGWKAQARSVFAFSGDAYNIEEGATNDINPNEINTTPGCDFNSYPEDHVNFTVKFVAHNYDGDPQDQSNFIRFLAPPQPVKTQTAGEKAGQALFTSIGCVLCHTTSFTTPAAPVPVLSNVQVNLFSDLLVHHMGPCHADNVVQGNVQGDEFRTAPLWGVSQRVFFMHEGATTDIVQAVEMHYCAANSTYPASEANAVVNAFNALTTAKQQQLINFLRSI